ncbi:MAG: type II toxin-antitoxin system VapB family antitoxin [Caldilineaceae bacterium]
MRTNIVIDDTLLAEALSCTGLSTKKAVIEEALRTLVRLKAQGQVRALRGHLHWEGDLHAMREQRTAYIANTEGDLEDDPKDDREGDFAASVEGNPVAKTTSVEADGDVDR